MGLLRLLWRAAEVPPGPASDRPHAEWIRTLVQDYLPGASQLLDWYHVAEYVAAAARATYTAPRQVKAWRTRQRNLLFAGRADAMLRGVARLIMRHSGNPAAVDKLRDLHRYRSPRTAR